MKKLFYLLMGISALAFTGCKSADEPINNIDKSQGKTETETPKDTNNQDGQSGLLAKGESTYMTFGLKDSEDLRSKGEAIRLEIGTAKSEDEAGVWIDLNGNGVRDNGENVTVFQQPAPGGTQQVYLVKTPLVRIYGKINYINCSANLVNKFISADIKHNPYLQIFWADNNKIPSLDLTKSGNLNFLSVSYNKLSSIDVSKLNKLKELDIAGNRIKTLSVDNNPAIENLHCDSNEIKHIDVRGLKKLKYFTCAINEGIQFDITQNSNLEILWAAKCGLKNIDVTHNPKLEDLELSLNNLSSIDVTNNPNLKGLDVSGCKDIHSLDLSKNKNLDNLWIRNTTLSSLDLSNNQSIRYIIMEYSNFSAEALNNLFKALPKVRKGTASIEYRDNPGTDKANFSIASDKGWKRNTKQGYRE